MTVQASLFDPVPEVAAAYGASGPDAPGVLNGAGPDGTADVPVGGLDGLVRHPLARGAWVDLLPGWTTGESLLTCLLEDVPWRAERRPMYDRVVDVPRLLCHYGEGEALPHPALVAMRDALNARYEPELGEPLVSAGLCLYRDGADSVAWHGDTIGRGRTSDTVVAIVSLGSPREFLLRPRGGGAVARAIAGADLTAARATTSPSALLAADPAVRSAAGSTAGPATGQDRSAPAGARPRGTGSGTIRHTLHHGDLVVMGGSCQRTWEHAVPKTARSVGPRVSIQFRPRGVR